MTDNKLNKIWSVSGGGDIALDLPVTDGGGGWHINAGLSFAALDTYIDLGLVLGASNLSTVGKIFPEAGEDIPGSYTENNHWQIGFEWGKSLHNNFAISNAKPWLALRSISHSGIYPGWTKLTNPGGTVGWITEEESSDTWTTLTLTKKTSKGMEFWPAPNFHIMPEIGFISSVIFPMVEDDKFDEWPFSVQGLQIYLNLTLGFGNPGTTLLQGGNLTLPQALIYFTQQAHGIAFDALLHTKGKIPQAGGAQYVNEIFGDSEDGGSMGGGSMWLTPHLQAVSVYLDSGSKLETINYHLHAPSIAYKIPNIIFEAGKAVGYIAAGSGGNAGDASLLTSGMASVNNLATIAAVEMGIHETDLFYLPFALGAFEMMISRFFDNGSQAGQMFLNAGSLTAAGWMKDPELGKYDIVESSTSSYSPTWGTNGGFAGYLQFRNHLHESALYTESGIKTPALINANLAANPFLNYSEEKVYTNTGSPAEIFSLLGVGGLWELGVKGNFSTGIGGGPILRIDSANQIAGLSAVGHLEFMINLFDKYSLTLGGVVGTNVTFDGTLDIFGGPSIGLHVKD